MTKVRFLLALATLVVALVWSRESRASTPQVFVGTAPALANYGPGTHLKFVTITLYDRPYVPGGDAQVVKMWHGWAPSNNEYRPGQPVDYYHPATFKDGTAVPDPVEGNGGHKRIQMFLFEGADPESGKLGVAGQELVDQGLARMKNGDIEFPVHWRRIISRGGGVTVDGNGGLIGDVEIKSGVNQSLMEHIHGETKATAINGDTRHLNPVEAEIYKQQFEEVMRNAPCECFVAGTAIATSKGKKRIEDVEEGDDVWSMGDDGPELHRVVHTMADPPRPTRFVTLSRNGHDERLETTDEHPFFVVGLGWTHAEALAAGNEVVTLSGETATVKSTESTKRSRPTFNFEVQGAHNYFVGANQTLVHNTCAVTKRTATSNRMTRFARLGQMRVGSVGGGVGGLLANFIASYAGQSVAGEAGALGAAFGAAAAMNRLGGASWRYSVGSAGASIGASFLTSYALKSAGVTNPFAHAGAGIAAGALVDGAIAYGTWTAAAGGTAGAAAGTAMLSSGLWGVLAFEVVYHAGQWYEIYQLNRAAANGDPAAQEALNEITFGGWLSPYNPQTYLLYGAYSWITRPGDVLGVSWLWGYKG